MNTADALGHSPVYRAVQIHAIAAKQLSLGATRGGMPTKTQPALIRRPDVNISRSAFIEQNVVSMACQGNAYWLKTFNETGGVVNVTVLNPLDVTPEGDKLGVITGYKVTGYSAVLKPSDVQHLSLLRVPGSLKGLGPIQAAQIELRGALDLRDYSSNWFTESGVPNGVLKSDQHLTPEVAENAKNKWNESQGARKGVAVLGAGLSYQPIYLSPADAQFLESQKFNVTQTARMFGVPASLMLAAVEGSGQTYSNIEQDWIAYIRFSLMAYLIEIEDALTQLLPNGTEAKFNIDALLRTDTKTRYEAHKIALDAGFRTINEIRDLENLPPLPAGAPTAPKETPKWSPPND